MKMITMRLNPAFKRTQPLPRLSADFAQRAGRAARSIAEALPLAAAASAAGRMVKVNLNVPATGLMG